MSPRQYFFFFDDTHQISPTSTHHTTSRKVTKRVTVVSSEDLTSEDQVVSLTTVSKTGESLKADFRMSSFRVNIFILSLLLLVPAEAFGTTSRRDAILKAAGTIAGSSIVTTVSPSAAFAIDDVTIIDKRRYLQRFPTLFAPLYGEASRETTLRQIGEDMWSIEQNLELGPLQVPIRCVVIRLSDGTLWVHNPLAPTAEFFALVESCAAERDGEAKDMVAHVVVPTYALEHKVFARDALSRWSNAKLWTSPGQFSFPIRSVPDSYIWGRDVSGVLDSVPGAGVLPPWTHEIEYETLEAGTFRVGLSPVTFYETAFYHKKSKALIVTDSLIRIPSRPPDLNDPHKLLLVSKRSTADPQPTDTNESRTIGWEKTCLLVSYFFPEHEELDPDAGPGVVTWTEGWHDNFLALSNRLLVPPVVRELIYAQNPASVRRWVDRVSERWDFRTIVPAHFDAPISANPTDFRRAFAFLEDETIDAFPPNDLARGLKPIADLALGKNRKQ